MTNSIVSRRNSSSRSTASPKIALSEKSSESASIDYYINKQFTALRPRALERRSAAAGRRLGEALRSRARRARCGPRSPGRRPEAHRRRRRPRAIALCSLPLSKSGKSAQDSKITRRKPARKSQGSPSPKNTKPATRAGRFPARGRVSKGKGRVSIVWRHRYSPKPSKNSSPFVRGRRSFADSLFASGGLTPQTGRSLYV